MLTDIMNASVAATSPPSSAGPSDLLDTSRLYRQDAVDAGEQSVAGMLDELERSLLEIVHSPSRISAADLEQMRRRIDAAALLFKVRVMSDELRQREQPPERSRAANNVNPNHQLITWIHEMHASSVFCSCRRCDWPCAVGAPAQPPPARHRRAWRRSMRAMAAVRSLSPHVGVAGWHDSSDDRADDLYSQGREAIEDGRYDRAVERFNALIGLKSSRTDAALYWKAYSLAKLGQRADALTTLADL